MTPGAAVVAVKRVDELSFYNLGLNKLAEHLGLTPPKTLSVIRYLKLQTDPDCYKQFIIGKTTHLRYSQKAVLKIQETLKTVSIDDIWKSHGAKARPRKKHR